MLAIADMLGGTWPTRARNALGEIFASPAAKDRSKKVELLADIRRIFESGTGEDKERLSSADLIAKLTADDSPWSESNHGKPLTPYGLAKLLSDFEIAPRSVRLVGTTAKGYQREWFLDAWTRYLPASNDGVLRLCSGSKNGRSGTLSPAIYVRCDDVTAKKGEVGQEEPRKPRFGQEEGCW